LNDAPLKSPAGVPALPHVGRLDNDTSGLLLLTDDGKLGERLLQKKRRPPGASDRVLVELDEEAISKEYLVDVSPGISYCDQ
jgi:16S rRNA U516 pseudouridylate synthase RsuA-like enzyme